MNKHLLTAVVFGMLLMARPAVANVITLDFAGSWGFYDAPGDVPSFEAAMATYGVTWGTANPLKFSMTIEDGAQGTPVGQYISYADAIQRVDFTVGSLTLGCNGTDCRPQTNGSNTTLVDSSGSGSAGFTTGPSMTGLPSIGFGFIPSFFNFRAVLPSGAPSLSAALADPGTWLRSSLLIGFSDGPNGPGGGGVFLGTSSLTFVSKSAKVPESTSLSFAAIGLLLLMLKARWRRVGRHSPD